MAAIQQNQLLFNLDVPAMPINLAAKYPKPEVIVIEKFGPCSGPVITPPKQAFQLSAISDDSLSQAVQLAKHDLKKQKQLAAAEKPGKPVEKAAKKGRTEIIRSSHYNERQKKREERMKQEKKRVLLMKEREKGWKSRTMTTQTGQFRNETPSHRMLSQMPASSMSPPTRDVGPDLTHLAGDARIVAEIKRLRMDIDACLGTIHKIHEAAKRNPSAWRPETLVYAEDIEAERKRVQRREEQETRSLRIIYQLNQQVRVMQDEVNRLGPANIPHDKKTQLLSRLAAIHRGTVRALQTFVQHITDYDLSHGLPRSYHEIGLLLRQLSLCCVQLEVTDESQVPENVMTLLKDYAEISKILDIQDSPKSPPRLCQVSKTVQNTKKQSLANRKLDFNAPPGLNRTEQNTEARQKQTQGPVIVDKVERDITPDRQAALRAAISNLMRNANRANNLPASSQRQKAAASHEAQPATRMPRAVAWDYPLEKTKLQQFKAGHRKGLLLPAKLRNQRRKGLRSCVPRSGDTHYAEPTLSSCLKEVPREQKDSSPSQLQPRRQPHHDTTSTHRRRSCSAPPSPRSPEHSRHHTSSVCSSPRSPSSYGSPRQTRGRRHASPFGSPADRRDLIRQVQIDRENVLRRKEKAKINRLRQELGQPEEWVRKAEEKIKERLQPLLDRAQADINADLLADSLLGELLEDTVHEIRDIDADTRAEQQAARMLNMPSVETMVQRLQEMEMEQQEIRRRWATLVYEEENGAIPAMERCFDALLPEQPSTPTPIHVTSKLPDVEQIYLPDSVLTRLESHPTDERAILFTKPVQQIKPKSTVDLSYATGSIKIKPEAIQMKPGIQITLDQKMIQSIDFHKKTYEQYLRNNSYQAIGHFNPWLVVEEVADEILDDCLGDVVKELEDINSDIVNKVYSGEFNKAPSPGSPKPSSPPHLGRDHHQSSAIRITKERVAVESEAEARHSEADQSSRRNSRQLDETLPSNGQLPSTDSVSQSYSYEDDFVESSTKSKSQDSTSK